ncbi:MAG: putative response regulator receiver domain protein [Friedmanniella sp.]|nr:putative response regulator receiver domain protein [Friedmanniella sp.]
MRTGPPLTVLIADDEADIRDFVTIKLERADIRVLAAADGREALALLATGEADLAVLDVMMPGMSGIDVVCHTRSTPGPSQHIPLVLLASRAQQADVELGLSVGATDYVTKPFSPQELLLRINAIMDRAR